MSNRQKKTETFIIKVMDQQNATWQGSVTWVDEQREQYFRSTLELLKLIDGALEKRNDDEENSDEDKRRRHETYKEKTDIGNRALHDTGVKYRNSSLCQ